MRHSKSRTNTFWDKTRIACNFTLSDVGNIMGVGRTAAGAYLSGLCMPSRSKVAALCEACNIDFDTGYHEFSKAYNTWEKNHPGYVRNGNSYKKVASSSKGLVDTPLYTPELEDLSSFNVGVGHRSRDTINNFWSNRKVEKQVSFKALAKATNKPLTSVRNYFIGRMVPDEDTIRIICDLLDVDYDLGVAEFAKLSNVGRHRSNKTKKAKKATKVITHEVSSATASTVDYLELLYGKVSFEDFQLISTAAKTKDDVLPFVYGQVDYKTYCQIADIL